VALEQRHGDINALHRRCKLASILRHPETPRQDPHHPPSTIHQKINLDLILTSAMLRLRLASRPVFLTAIFSGCSRLHAAPNSDTPAVVARNTQCRWSYLGAVDDEVCEVSSYWSIRFTWC